MTFRGYQQYKDSGVAWPTRVPSTWGMTSIKRLATFVYGDALPSDNRDEEGSVLVCGSNGAFSSHSEANTSAPVLLIGRKGSYGALNWYDVPVFAIDTVYFTDDNHTSCNLRWLYWALHTAGLDTLSQDTGVPGLSRETAYRVNLPHPPLAEQIAIAAFLDRETGKIDALVDEQRRLIELLKEKRQAVISHAVTKGLNPDAKMKNSGVDWLGEVPEHWQVKRLGQLAGELKTGPFGSQLHSEDYVDGGTPVINPSNLRDGEIVADWSSTVDEAMVEQLGRHRLEVGDIVFGRRGEMGRCAHVTKAAEGWLCGTGSLRVRLRKPEMARFFCAFLRTPAVASYLRLVSVGSTMDNLNTSILSRIPVPCPPVEEASQIIEVLDGVLERLGDLSNEAEQGVRLLQERRAALISATVTGKIDVREMAEAIGEAA